MANIRKRGSKWQVQVRRAGQLRITKTFNKKSDAHVWARDMDAKGDRGEIGRIGDNDLTFGCLLKKYRAEVVANKLAVNHRTMVDQALACPVKRLNI
ncbi:DUF2188 domain-containing protein [Kordiimonas lipolytica]|uniref:DUF2188 domain-containing protein n=1 Tax=Kordiimonas lipolytica TaxID=1662421 RepID=A0ABV8U6A7_9PROT|nr:DUF2188 domain-containing protein [Kordiimonas lipolytica]